MSATDSILSSLTNFYFNLYLSIINIYQLPIINH